MSRARPAGKSSRRCHILTAPCAGFAHSVSVPRRAHDFPVRRLPLDRAWKVAPSVAIGQAASGGHSLVLRSKLVPHSHKYLQRYHFMLDSRMTLALHLHARPCDLANSSSRAPLFARSFRSCASARHSTSLFSIACALFEKTTGDRGGVRSRRYRCRVTQAVCNRPETQRKERNWQLLWNEIHANCFPRNRPIFIFIRIARGVGCTKDSSAVGPLQGKSPAVSLPSPMLDTPTQPVYRSWEQESAFSASARVAPRVTYLGGLS